MSVHNAIQFIQKVEQDDELKAKIRSGLPNLDLEDLVKMGAESGLAFTVSDFRTAFTKDWAARWAFYSFRAPE
jgi:predicted ribosomally synthesized peptide with nif11-like leader